MALTPEQYQNAILTELNDPTGTLSGQMVVLWELFVNYAAYPQERYYRVKIAAIDLLLGIERDKVDFSSSGDLSVKRNQRFTNLIALRSIAEKGLATLLGSVGRGYVIGQLTAIAPVSRPMGSAGSPGEWNYGVNEEIIE